MYVYHDMIREVLKNGTRKPNRTGVDTLSTWNYNYELLWESRLVSGPRYVMGGRFSEPGDRVPLLTTKKISWKNIVVELLWFLSGDRHIGFLQRHGCKFWDPWADDSGEVPSAYGNFWRHFPTHESKTTLTATFNDQIRWVLDELKRNPMSRRLFVSAWAPGNAQTSKLPPCHLLFGLNVQNMLLQPWDDRSAETEPRLCMHLTQRSCDLALGVPYNMASYGLLLLLFCHLSGIKPGIFAHTLCDLHIYTSKPDGSMEEHDHVPGLMQQLKREPRESPTVIIDPAIQTLEDIEALVRDEGVTTAQLLDVFKLQGYDPFPAITFKVAV